MRLILCPRETGCMNTSWTLGDHTFTMSCCEVQSIKEQMLIVLKWQAMTDNRACAIVYQ